VGVGVLEVVRAQIPPVIVGHTGVNMEAVAVEAGAVLITLARALAMVAMVLMV